MHRPECRALGGRGGPGSRCLRSCSCIFLESDGLPAPLSPPGMCCSSRTAGRFLVRAKGVCSCASRRTRLSGHLAPVGSPACGVLDPPHPVPDHTSASSPVKGPAITGARMPRSRPQPSLTGGDSDMSPDLSGLSPHSCTSGIAPTSGHHKD